MGRQPFEHEISANEFVSLGINSEEQDRRRAAMERFPEFAQFGDFLTSERRINGEVLKEMSSSANIFGDYNLSIHESLTRRETFKSWKGMTAPDIDAMEDSIASTTMFRWILKGFYLHCEEKGIRLPPALNIFSEGSCVYLQNIAEFIELLY